MNRINLISLGVKNISESLKFYKALGFKCYEKEDNPPVVFFDNQGSKLSLYPKEKLAKDINVESPPEMAVGDFKGFTLAINVKSEKEVDDLLSLVRKNKGEIVKEAQEVFWGGYHGYFRDLDGYYWEVAFGQDWEFDDNDMLVIE